MSFHVVVPHVTDYRVTKGGTNGYRTIALACAGVGRTAVHQLEPDTTTAPSDSAVSRLSVRSHPDLPTMLAAISAELQAGDVVVKCVGAGRREDHLLDGEVVSLAVQARAKIAYLDGDAPVRLERMPFKYYLRDLLPSIDLVLLLGGGTQAEQQYRELGARDTLTVPVAATVHALADTTSSLWQSDVPGHGGRDIDLIITVGKASAREDRLPEWIAAATRAGYRVVFVGGDPPDMSVECLDPRDPVMLHDLHLRSRFTLNLLRDTARRFGYAPPNRVFEAAVAGSVVITEPYPGIELDLLPGTECHVLDAPEELPALLSAPCSTWTSTSAAGRRRVLASSRQGMAVLRGALARLASAPPPPRHGHRPIHGWLERLDGLPVVAHGPVPAAAIDAAANALPRSEIRASSDDTSGSVVVMSMADKEGFDDHLNGRKPEAVLVWFPPGTVILPGVRWLPGRDWLLTETGITTQVPS